MGNTELLLRLPMSSHLEQFQQLSSWVSLQDFATLHTPNSLPKAELMLLF